MLSMPRLLAASISITSMSSPRAMALHELHSLHGSAVGPLDLSQLRHLARIRAVEVLPVPRVPQNRYAWAMRPEAIAFFSVRATWSCPMTSSNVVERYFRARTRYDIALYRTTATDR